MYDNRALPIRKIYLKLKHQIIDFKSYSDKRTKFEPWFNLIGNPKKRKDSSTRRINRNKINIKLTTMEHIILKSRIFVPRITPVLSNYLRYGGGPARHASRSGAQLGKNSRHLLDIQLTIQIFCFSEINWVCRTHPQVPAELHCHAQKLRIN